MTSIKSNLTLICSLHGRKKMKSLEEASVFGFGSLSEAMEARIEKYFEMHSEVTVPTGLYDIIMKEIEKGLINVTMRHAGGNKVKAARILGINRNTLHKKLLTLDLEDEY